jgi:hypothetical protein
MSGVINVSLTYPDRVEPWYKEENLIVLVPRQALLSMVYLEGRLSDPIRTLQVGTGGSIDPEAKFPKPVTKTMTELYNSILSVNTSYSVDNSTPSVTFIGDISESQGVNQLINEAGLFTLAGTMFNIKTFPGIPKTSEFGIHIEWAINFG